MSDNKYDAIVVGGGIAGLTSAVYLARSGQKILLIEKNKKCGGLVNTFARDGFRFEAGVRALEDAGIIFPMLNDLGIELDVVKSPVSVGIGEEIMHVGDLSSLEEYKNLLVKVYPDSKKEIEKFIKIVLRIMKHMEVLYGVENPAFKDLTNDRAYFFKQLLPWLPKFIFTVGKINRMNMPVENYLADVISNESLRDIITQHFFKNTPAFFALSYFTLYMDYFYPKGGVGKLSEAVKEKFIGFGGVVKTGTLIKTVDAQQRTVTDQNGMSYEYRNLIWAADLKTLYSQTNTNDLSPAVMAAFKEKEKQFFKSRGTDSVFSLYLEVDEPLESFGKVANGHFFYTPSEKGLGRIHREELDELLNNWSLVSKEQVLEWLDRFTEFNTYEISIPGLKDPGLVPQGKSGVIVSLLAEYDLFKKIKDDGWYKEFKSELETRMIDVLSNSIYPMLKGKVLSQFSFTPVSIEERTGSSEGAIIGWSFEKPIPVMHKIQYSKRSVMTPIPNIFQAGQWAYSPGGVPMSMLTGKFAADRVIKSFRKTNSGKSPV